MRYFVTSCSLMVLLSTVTMAQQPSSAALPEAPSAVLVAETTPYGPPVNAAAATSFPIPHFSSSVSDDNLDPDLQKSDAPQTAPQKKRSSLLGDAVDANGNPIPLEKQQPKRILGFMPNYRTVSAGAATHPLGWKYNFTVATKQAFDYSSFVFLGLTSLSAEGLNEHPALGKGADGFYAYTWRGFVDKTDGTYLSAFFLPSLLHEDTRYHPLGHGHRVVVRALYVVSRQGVALTYGGRPTPNLAGLGGKVLTQVISRNYYPAGSTDFGVLAEKFGYSVMRDVIFSSIREFYPDIAAHYIRKHREKAASMSARDVNAVTP